MIKLDGIYKNLEEIKGVLESIIEATEANALAAGRELTEDEDEHVMDMQGEVASIDCALSFIVGYCDDIDFPIDEEGDE